MTIMQTLVKTTAKTWKQVALPPYVKRPLPGRETPNQERIGTAIIDLLDLHDGWAGDGTFAPSQTVVRNTQTLLSRIDEHSSIRPCVNADPRGTVIVTYYLPGGDDIEIEVGNTRIASSTNLEGRDDLFAIWDAHDSIPAPILTTLGDKESPMLLWHFHHDPTSW